MNRKISDLGLLLSLACFLLFIFTLMPEVPAETTESDADHSDQRLEELQKEIEDAVNNGQAPSQELINEMMKILEEMQEEQDSEDGDAEEESESFGRWSSVPFTGHITINKALSGYARMPQEGDKPGEPGGTATWTGSSTGSLSAVITNSIEIRDDEGNIIGYQPVGFVTGRVLDRETLKSKGFSSVSNYSASDRKEHAFDPENLDGWCRLALNPDEGLYDIHFPSISLGSGEGKSVITVSVPGGEHVETEPWGGVDARIDWDSSRGPHEDKRRYRPGSSFISGSHTYVLPRGGLDMEILREGVKDSPWRNQIQEEFSTIAGQMASAAGNVPGFYEGTWTVTWSLQIGKVPVKVEIEPKGDYENWVPALVGGLGNTVRVKAKIVEPAGLTGKIEFLLEDVSREPGICLNIPHDSPDKKADLIFSHMSEPEIIIKDEGLKATTADDVNEAEVVLQAMDYGAYAKLTAVATVVVNGKEMEVRAVNKTSGEHWVSLPKDENSNSIADSWEKSHGIYPAAGDADDDNEPEGKAPGDGLSTYEEYRGFHVKGAHVRLNPAKKDLFIYDPDGLAERAGFGGVTRLEAHYISEREGRCTGSKDKPRVVNFNTERYHVVDQHCLWFKKDRLPAPDRFNWGGCEGGAEIGPPRTADMHVLVFVDQIRSDIGRVYMMNLEEIRGALEKKGVKPDMDWMESLVTGAVNMVTLHEGCHGLGITHHYTSLRLTLPKTDEIEKDIISGNLSPSMGQMSCVMRYIWDSKKHPRLTFKADEELLDLLKGRPWPNTLCETIDDCRGQMLVSDAEKGQYFD